MRLWAVTLLTVLAVAIGVGVGVVSGFLVTVLDRIAIDAELACVLLQKAETARFITTEQRVRLVDIVLPEARKAARETAAESDLPGSRWYDARERWRVHMKSGCPDA